MDQETLIHIRITVLPLAQLVRDTLSEGVVPIFAQSLVISVRVSGHDAVNLPIFELFNRINESNWLEYLILNVLNEIPLDDIW
jgi:hypothetical protein